MGSRRSNPVRDARSARPTHMRLGCVVAITGLAALVAGCGESNVHASPSSSSSQLASATETGMGPGKLNLVVIGDSIAFNSPDDCPDCRGFIVRYAAAVQAATGETVDVQNLSQHNGLQLPGLLDELDGFQGQLTGADVIVVGIAHNSNELASDTPCGGTLDAQQIPDWAKMTPACAAASAKRLRPLYDHLFAQIASWRKGKPTILRTLNRYNDWLGGPATPLTPAQAVKVKTFIDDWDAMLCQSATSAGFLCADIYRAFNGPSGTKPSGDLLSGDYTHPSDKGNAVIAKVLAAQGFAPLAPS